MGAVNRTRVAIAVLLLVGLAACSTGDKPPSLEDDVTAEGPQGIQSATIGGVHWTTGPDNVRRVVVIDRQSDPEGTAALRSYIGVMQKVWSSYPGLPYLEYRRDARPCQPAQVGSVIQVCTGNPGSGIAGTTHYSYDGAKHYRWANVLDRDQPTVGWAYSLICHELGHAIGLGHSSEPGSCMTATLDRANKGYSGGDLNDLLGVYYGHFPG